VPFPPNAFIIGAAKAGTTYLAGLLDQHPDVCVSFPKEPHYFTKHQERSLDWYRSCFADPDALVLLDGSTSYAAAPFDRMAEELTATDSPLAGVPERIRAVSPDARFIYLMRDPVERTYSVYWHRVRAGLEDRPFRQAFTEDASYRHRASDYVAQIREYLRVYPLDRFLFLRFEDLRSAPEATVHQCLDFLEVGSDVPVRPDDAGTHPSYRPGRLLGMINAVERRVPWLRRAQQQLSRHMPAGLRDFLRGRLSRPVPEMGHEERELVARHFAPMLPELEELTGLSVAHWCCGMSSDTGGVGGAHQRATSTISSR